MDALPLQESSVKDYSSEINGVMHACGHDVYIACCLGAARILSSIQSELSGNVVFIFQPAEEIALGAKKMIGQGVLYNPNVDAMMALHVWPHIPSGFIGIREGEMFAASDKFKITITGKSGHGAHPHRSIDPISAATQIYSSIQSILSREQNLLHPLVITIGEFNSGTSYNIIPDEARLCGSVRMLDKDTRKTVRKRIEELSIGIGTAMKCEVNVEYQAMCDILNNDTQLVRLLRNTVCDILGESKVVELMEPSMGSEDCAYFFNKVPGVYFRLGVGSIGKNSISALHSTSFDIEDESVIALGATVLAQSAINFLTKTN